MTDHAIDELEAWERFDIVTVGDEVVVVHWSTNDDGETGWPGTYAEDDYRYHGADALEKARKYCGVSRQGVGHRVYVTLDGEAI